mmetsp:Transcript_36213/g.35153  ORF Transcript_36213/g.35153 Transcript_36213/m.35153 type:complete len:80 (-) Transcript_36213:21-260(-)
MVTTELGIEDQKEAILNEYDKETEVHDSENRTRLMFKYSLTKGVSGTPTVFVNDVMLDSLPFRADGWYTLLEDTYNSQI